MKEQNKVYGVTEPLSMNKPSAKDLESTAKLKKTLEDAGQFEPAREKKLRYKYAHGNSYKK
jgi:poly(A) polymerase Pap1